VNPDADIGTDTFGPNPAANLVGTSKEKPKPPFSGRPSREENMTEALKMREETFDATTLTDEVMRQVRAIVETESNKQKQLSALRELTTSLGEAAARCQHSYDAAATDGNDRAMSTLKRQHDLLDRAIHYVAATARNLARKKKRMSFETDLSHFVEPKWEGLADV
jgi:hypothetical protein